MHLPNPRLLISRIAWLAAAACLASCARHETRVESGNREKVLHWGNGSEPATVDPNVQAAAIEATIGSALFEGLVNIAIDGTTILPGVAERWDISADRKVYTFHLRADARWSDGTPVTADDFAFSFRRVAEPAMGCQVSDTGYAIAGVFDYVNGRSKDPASLGFRAVDPRTFELRLLHPAPYILYVLGQTPWMPVPRAVVERFGKPFEQGNLWARAGNLVSNGAFTLKSWLPNANLTVSRNPYYWDRAHVRLSEVRFYPTDNPDTEERGFRSGEFHLTYRVPLSKLAAYREAKAGVLRISPQLATWFVVFNTHRAPFDKAAVRRAFSLAIDRDRLVPDVLHETATPAHTLCRPGMGGWTAKPAADYDPDLARRLLAEAGYPAGAGFPRVEFTTRSSGTDPLLTEALQQMWQKELGVRIEVAQQEPKVVIDTLYSHDFQIGLSGWFAGIDSQEFVLTLARGGSPSNMADWADPAFDRAFRAAEEALTPAEHGAAAEAMEERIREEAPYAPIYYFNQCQLVDPSLHGWQGNLIQQTDWRALSVGDAP